jgi:uncharacterized membrane protein
MNNNEAKINKVVQPNKVTPEAVYAEMYNEMRRFRDYEFTSSMWYTAILLAIVGFVASTRFANSPEDFAKLSEDHLWLKITIAAVALLIAAASSYLIYYSYSQYDHLRTWTSDNL